MARKNAHDEQAARFARTPGGQWRIAMRTEAGHVHRDGEGTFDELVVDHGSTSSSWTSGSGGCGWATPGSWSPWSRTARSLSMSSAGRTARSAGRRPSGRSREPERSPGHRVELQRAGERAVLRRRAPPRRVDTEAGRVHLATERASGQSPFEVFYDADGRTVRLTTPDELLRIVEQRGGDPVADVTGAAKPFALLVGALLERGRVIELPELYDFLEPMFDLAVAEAVPRVVDRHLTFVLAKPSELPPGYSVCRVSLDLDTFVVTLAPVAVRRAPAGWGAPAGT